MSQSSQDDLTYDSLIIGSGPGGYVCAIRMAQLGFKTAIVERYNTLGGTCLNVGCIPSKALLDSSEHFYQAKHSFAEHGIHLDSLSVDMNQMIARKAQVVDDNVKGIDYLMNKNKIKVYHGHARFVENHVVSIDSDEGQSIELRAKNIVIATGSKPSMPASFNYDKKRIISSTEALKLAEVPDSMIVIGGGVIGLELGSVFARLGTQIIVIEYMDSILANMDKDQARELTKVLKKQNFTFHTKHAVEKVSSSDAGVTALIAPRDGGDTFEVKADYCLVAVGRRPYTDGLGLENTDVQLNEKGFIVVDNSLRTNAEGIYAIGDVIGGAMLAHKAEDEGVYIAEQLAGQKPHIDYNLIPSVVYTWPEVASVGQTEEELKRSSIPYKKGKFAIKALGRARASMDLDGFVKVLAHQDTDEVLGVHMVAPRAADMIQEATAIMEFKGASEDIARICHPHPTYTEAIKEAALDVDGRSIHM